MRREGMGRVGRWERDGKERGSRREVHEREAEGRRKEGWNYPMGCTRTCDLHWC